MGNTTKKRIVQGVSAIAILIKSHESISAVGQSPSNEKGV